MEPYQRQFIEFAIECGALRFGEFVLKSGRQSPYFFNTGQFSSGRSLARLAGYYAQAIQVSGLEFDMLFGPAYKGIPLVAAIAVAISDGYDRDLPYAFDRKEAKDHGEGGMTIGAALAGRVLIADDVISAGTSTRHSIALIRAAGATPVGIAISLDREERGAGEQSAIQEIERDLGLAVVSVVKLRHLLAYLEEQEGMESDLDRVREYRAAYGIADGGAGSHTGA